jgi:phosphonate transport system permease protein
MADVMVPKKPNKAARFFAQQKAKYKAFDEKLTWETVPLDLSPAQDGSQIRYIKKRKKTKLIIAFSALIVLFGLSFVFLGYSYRIKILWGEFFGALGALFTPKVNHTNDAAGWWSFSWASISQNFVMGINTYSSLWTLFEYCFLGTTIGCVFAIPLYYLCARNVAKHAYIYQPVRIICDFFRSVPMFIVCIFLSLIIGGGNALTAVLSFAFFTTSIMYEMMYEYIETLDMQPFESVRSCGGNNLQCMSIGLHPEVKPMFFAYAIYTLEINIRASVILSYAGLSGTFVNGLADAIDYGWYDWVGSLLLPLFVLVCILQFVSNQMARRLR